MSVIAGLGRPAQAKVWRNRHGWKIPCACAQNGLAAAKRH